MNQLGASIAVLIAQQTDRHGQRTFDVPPADAVISVVPTGSSELINREVLETVAIRGADVQLDGPAMLLKGDSPVGRGPTHLSRPPAPAWLKAIPSMTMVRSP